MDIFETLKQLSETPGAGGMKNINRLCKSLLAPLCDEVSDVQGGVLGVLGGDSGYTLLLDAHIDEIGLMVKCIDGGFIKAEKCGGIDVRTLPATAVTVWGGEPLPGVFCAAPPHLASDSEKLPEICDLAIDTGLPADTLKEKVHPGDRITFDCTLKHMMGDTVCGKALDNRAGVLTLLLVLDKIKTSGKKPPVNVAVLLSEQEELGCRGAKIGAFDVNVDEAIAVDVSFGDSPLVPDHKTGKLSGGPMIGISPTLDKSITDKLLCLAGESSIPFQTEVMGGITSTNSDVIGLTKNGIRCGLISVPLRNMHTPSEIVALSDIGNSAELICDYVNSGGAACEQ